MERWHAQENLSHLVNIDALLGKLAGSAAIERPQPEIAVSPEQAPPSPSPTGQLAPLSIQWPREALLPTLRDRLDVNRAAASVSEPALDPPPATPFRESLAAHVNIDRLAALAPRREAQLLDHNTTKEALSKLLEILVNDVLASRDKLLMLNPGRRKLIEHRLEFIARKVARSRGERLNRSLSLPEILKESYREPPPGSPNASTKLGMAAWRGFVCEVALYNLLELFFLKSLEVYGWRTFEPLDVGRMNFAAHSFLSQRAAGFAHDKHCWNFVRTNLYSWYVPTQRAQAQLLAEVQAPRLSTFSWSDKDLENWVLDLPDALRPAHLEFVEEAATGRFVVELLERKLSLGLTSKFQSRAVCRKFFLPALEMGGVALSILDRLIQDVKHAAPGAYDGGLADESTQFHRSIWACESESFEIFWTEVLALLKILKNARQTNDFSSAEAYEANQAACLYRLPQATHVVNALGLELHNMEQLPLGGAEVSKLQQGSAAQIQQIENFDYAVVTDHPDRVKSAAWMKALSQQLSYWRTIVGAGTNLNWGELHLFLALTKLKENGYCVYLSHRTLPEGGDGEKLRKALLNVGTLEYFVELGDAAIGAYRFLYVFRRETKKLERDQHRPKFGKLRSGQLGIDLSALEEANSTQAEIYERGWDHLFVRGAAPLIRHLNHKFPKLFQLASLGESHDSPVELQALFRGSDVRAIEATIEGISALRFQPASSNPAHAARDRLLVYPHNPIDLCWISALLNSAPAQFWIRHQVLGACSNKNARPGERGLSTRSIIQELRSCPIIDLSHAPTDLVHEALEWIGTTKPDLAILRAWALAGQFSRPELYARFVALAKRHAQLDRLVARYRPLFSGSNFEELRHEAVGQFYPSALLCHVSQSPDVRIQYAERGRSSLMPENWVLAETRTVAKEVGGKPMTFILLQTLQGPVVQMLVPMAIRQYVCSQLQALRNHTWGEALTLLLIPRDIPLFAAQTSEVTRVVSDTAHEMRLYEQVLAELALELFEISPELRQYLGH